MHDDRQLLARYVTEGSEDAFTELVTWHLNFVYSAARRQTMDGQHAEDVTQVVFARLARKAASLSPDTVLAGWLHRATRYAALDLLRSEARRKQREQEATAVNSTETSPAPEWEKLKPLLDEALDKLKPVERDALLLRFFEQRSLKDVGAALGAGEDAARKRVDRALEKVRAWLARRGVTTTAVALASAMTANGVQVAPATLGAAAISSSAAAAIAGGGFAISKLLPIVIMNKGQIAAVVVAAGLATGLFMEAQSNSRLRTEMETLKQQSGDFDKLRMENQRLSNLLAQANQVRPNDPSNELLRLRAETTRLRNELQAAAAAPRATTNQARQQPDPPRNATNSLPYTASIQAHVSAGEVVLSGGWSFESGKRTFVLVRSSLTPQGDSSAKGDFRFSAFEIPETAMSKLNLAQFAVQGNESRVCQNLSASDSDALVNAVEQTDGADVFSSPHILTADGVEAAIGVGNDGTGFSITLNPRISADGQAADLAVNLKYQPQ